MGKRPPTSSKEAVQSCEEFGDEWEKDLLHQAKRRCEDRDREDVVDAGQRQSNYTSKHLKLKHFSLQCSLPTDITIRLLEIDFADVSHTCRVASQARLFRAVAELTARESHEEEELLPELLQREKSLVAFENVIVTWDPRSDFIA